MKIRMGIDVGGTHTKAVAIDNDTQQIVGNPSVVMTTHDDKLGVAKGVVDSFTKCLEENNIRPEDVVFVAHSTTQATNALLEGDVANVGVFAVAGGGIEGFLAKRQSRLDDIDLQTGRVIRVLNAFLKKKQFNPENIQKTIEDLEKQGADVIVASMAFGVDSAEEENMIRDAAVQHGLMATMASEITKLYGLTRRTRTAVINASILPKMLNTANCTEQSVRQAGVNVPLMIMRGDGGVMDVSEMRRRPVLTMLSGPAASVMGSLMYLRASNGIYFEVGGTSTNIGVIKNGRPGTDYTVVGGHKTYVNSLDVRVLGVAGGSMVRANKNGIVDVGPRSAHIAGLEYAVYQKTEDIRGPKVELYSPKEGDPADYVRIRMEDGKCVAITNSCAANVLGLVTPEHFSYGNVEAARKAMQPLADYIGKTVEETAEQILAKAYEKIEPVILDLADKYKLEKDQMSMVGVGGGAASLIIYSADKLGLHYTIPKYAEVISSIGVALAMVRDVVERIIPDPTAADLAAIRKEAEAKAIESGAVPDSVDVHIEIDTVANKVTAVALGSTEVKTAEVLKECSDEEAWQIAADDLRAKKEEITLLASNRQFKVFGKKTANGRQLMRILDKKGFIKVQRGDGVAVACTVGTYKDEIKKLWDELAVFSTESILRPDFYLCVGGKIADFNNLTRLEHLHMLIDLELAGREPDEEIIIAAARNRNELTGGER